MPAHSENASCLNYLESESIYILREVAAQFSRPAILFSGGKDSSVIAHLAKKAFAPAPMPFPLLHIDTGHNFPEVLEFRDKTASSLGAQLFVCRNEEAIANKAHPSKLGTQRCCALLQTDVLLEAIRKYGFDALIGGARRDEEKSRAKERIFSFRDRFGQWDPRAQRPELWKLLNGHVRPGESIRAFPISNWTEKDVWDYIERESIRLPSLYYSSYRQVVNRNGTLIPVGPNSPALPTEKVQISHCRFRTLGCAPCTGAVPSQALNTIEVIRETSTERLSERSTRIIDHDSDCSMETKKRQGYF